MDADSRVTQLSGKQELLCSRKLAQFFCAIIRSHQTALLTLAGDTQMVAPSTTSVIQRRLVTNTSNAMSFLIKIYSRRTQPRIKEAPCATLIRTSRQFISTKARVGGSCKTLHRKILPRVTTQRSLKVHRSLTQMDT